VIGTSLLGVTWADVLEFVAVKLTPAVSIVGGLLAARAQLRNNRRLNAEMIAKNHFRKMLREFRRQPDLLFAGITEPALEALRSNIPEYRRYALLYATCMFSMQEVFLAIDLKKENNWANTIRNFCSIFKPFLQTDGAAFEVDVDPAFLAWVREAVKDFEHPFAHLSMPTLHPKADGPPSRPACRAVGGDANEATDMLEPSGRAQFEAELGALTRISSGTMPKHSARFERLAC
jgi:hypothetical protein